jgi:hypothetical protein
MKTFIFGITALGALGLGLAGCNGGATNVPPLNTGPSALATPLPANPATPSGAYVQIELLARPAVKEALESFNNHKVTNKVEPYVGSPADPLQGEIKATVDLLRPPKNGADFGAALQGVLYPNEIAADLSNTTDKASYLGVETGGATGGKFGGRDIADDVINIDLGAIFGNTLVALGLQPEDNQENACLSQQSPDVKTLQRPSQASIGVFPYLSPPH